MFNFVQNAQVFRTFLIDTIDMGYPRKIWIKGNAKEFSFGNTSQLASI